MTIKLISKRQIDHKYTLDNNNKDTNNSKNIFVGISNPNDYNWLKWSGYDWFK